MRFFSFILIAFFIANLSFGDITVFALKKIGGETGKVLMAKDFDDQEDREDQEEKGDEKGDEKEESNKEENAKEEYLLHETFQLSQIQSELSIAKQFSFTLNLQQMIAEKVSPPPEHRA